MNRKESRFKLIRIENMRTKILKEKEAQWKFKSRVIWMECEDEIKKKFHACASK